jgi:molybdenum cofactor guanylyltransferase
LIVAGIVLAGGRSRRFGSEKAAATMSDGRPMMAHVLERLRPACAVLAVNARPDAAAARLGAPLPVLCDRPGDPDGPLSGVLAGLDWCGAAGADVLVTAPCDTPFLPADLVHRLIENLTDDALAAYARTSQGDQPLCAAWRIAAAPVLADTLTREHPPVRRMLERLRAVAADFEDAGAFANFNTPGAMV